MAVKGDLKPTTSKKPRGVQTPTKAKNAQRGSKDLGKTVQLTVESKVSQLVHPQTNTFYTFASSITREVDENTDIDAAYEDMWNEVNGQVDKELEEVHKMYKPKRTKTKKSL